MLIFLGIIFGDCLRGSLFAFGIGGIDTAIHEAGHILFRIFGSEAASVAGGTISQLLIPLLVGVSFIRQEDYFGVATIFAWLGINLFDISRYVGDAVEGRLPLLMLFGEGPKYIHDWSYMLGKMGLLYHTDVISSGIWICAIVSFSLCFLYSALLIINRLREGEI